MAKAEFKNKVTKAQEDLFKALENEKEKRHTYVTKIVNELNKQKKANVKNLSSLNKEYLALCQNNQTELQVFIDKVSSLNNELTSGINTFNENYNLENEKNKLIEEKDKILAPLKQKAKREGHDINTKMERIDKELNETLENRKMTFDENEKTYRNKVLEYDRRRRIEIQKIQNNIVKECEEFQKRLIVENKRSEINKLKKAIKEIRYNGLLTEKETLLRYADDIESYELNHALEVFNYNKENSDLIKDYKTRYTSVKLDKLLNEQRYNNEFNLYEIEVNNTLAVQNKDMLEKQNGIKEVYIDKIYKANINQLEKEKKINKLEQDSIINTINNAEKLDNMQIKKFQDLNLYQYKSMENEFKLYQKNLNLTLNFYLQNILSLYQAYFKDLFAKEATLLNTFLINDISGDVFNNFDFTSSQELLMNIFNTFKEMEESTINKFQEKITNIMNMLIEQVDVFVTNMSNLNMEINEEINNYHQKLSALFTTTETNIIDYINNIQTKKQEDINSREEANTAFLSKGHNDNKIELEAINVDYNKRVADVNIQKQEQETKYQSLCASIKTQIAEEQKMINDNYDNDLLNFQNEKLEKEENIKNKFIEERSKIEKTYKTKIGLL